MPFFNGRNSNISSGETDHSHANKALLDTYNQTNADLSDAVSKKHEHANKDELDLIEAGDVASWDSKLETIEKFPENNNGTVDVDGLDYNITDSDHGKVFVNPVQTNSDMVYTIGTLSNGFWCVITNASSYACRIEGFGKIDGNGAVYILKRIAGENHLVKTQTWGWNNYPYDNFNSTNDLSGLQMVIDRTDASSTETITLPTQTLITEYPLEQLYFYVATGDYEITIAHPSDNNKIVGDRVIPTNSLVKIVCLNKGSNDKWIVQNFGNGSGDDLSELNDGVAVLSDKIAFNDTDDSNITKLESLEDLQTLLSRSAQVSEDNALDFNANQNMTLTATAANITVGAISNAVGQSGVITIASSENITGWASEFKWFGGTAPADLSGTERFAYFIESTTSIAIGRVQ